MQSKRTLLLEEVEIAAVKVYGIARTDDGSASLGDYYLCQI
jgi:hypothetical protein